MLMPNELRDQLQASLGGAFEVREELGGGGMSRVFAARDAALARDVVIKVLHPDLFGGIAVDRFKREIQVVAQLQHPHVVPILAAGEVDGLPYLTMPFVEGRSLRERLGEAHRLPVEEVVTVLRDVARALDYAHSRGVIHRDIKPDNVLLSRGAATVTDFGVAKAVSAARGDGVTLTSVGTSIGTPTYMAPEQAAGDPATDGRADIYAWGVMAYELLAGDPPFVHSSPQRQIAAHLTETPVPVAAHRPECPPALAALVMECLQKDPAARPQTAADLVQALAAGQVAAEAVVPATIPAASSSRRTLLLALGVYAMAFLLVAALAQTAVDLIGLPDWVLDGALIAMALGLPVILITAAVGRGVQGAQRLSTRRRDEGSEPLNAFERLGARAGSYLTWRRVAFGGAAAVSAFAMLVVGFMTLRAIGVGPAGSLFARGVLAEQDEVLVTDFSVSHGDTSLGPVLSEGVRTSLAQSRTLGVVTGLQTAAALRRMELDPSTRLGLPLARQLAEREGIKAVLDGTITPVDGSYIITLKLYATADTSELVTVQETAAGATDLIPAVDRVARRLRERVGDSFKSVREAPRLERVTTASLPALRKYTEGWRANTFESNWPKAIAALEEAVRLDTTFALAYRQAAVVYINAGLRPGRSDTLLQLAFQHRERLPALERALVEGSYYSYSSARDRTLAIAAYERAVEADSTNASALNSLGLEYINRRQPERAIPIFEQMVRAHPQNSFAVSNLATALKNSGREEAARDAVAEGMRRFPDNPNVLAWQRIFWTGDRQRDSARTLCQSLATHVRMNTQAVGVGCLYAIAMMEGRLRTGWRHAARGTSIAESLGREGSAMFARLDSLHVEALLLGRGEGVVRELDRTLSQNPPGEDAIGHRVRIGAAQVYALAGATEKARTLLGEYDRLVTDSAGRRASHLRRHLALGEIAIAEGRHTDAVRLFQRADTLHDGAPQPCDVCVLPRLANAYSLAGDDHAAIEAYERYLQSNYAWRRTDADDVFYAAALKRLGELHDKAGNREAAIAYLRRFVDLWKAADPELQPVVQDARRRLVELERGRG